MDAFRSLIPINKLWCYRFLAFMLVWKSIRARYSRTILGPLWVILQPLAPTLLATIFLSQFFKSGNHPYWKETASAMVVWSFFSNIVDRASTSLQLNEDLITKIYFPRVLLPMSGAIAALIDLTVVGLGTILIVTGLHLTWGVLLFPIYCLPVFFFALGTSLLLSSTMIFVRDLRIIQPFITQLGIYVTPVLYPFSLLSESLQHTIILNPLVVSILGVQASMGLGSFPSFLATFIDILGTGVFLILSWIYFNYLESEFADQI